MMRLAALALRRLAQSLPVLVIILVGLFLLLQLAPGDTVDALMAQMGGGSAEDAARLREQYGLDAGVAVQLGRYLLRLASFDLVIGERLAVTALFMSCALAFAFAAGLVLGVLAARRVNGWPDTLISTLGLVFYAIPSFWLGLMLIVLFSVKLAWLPPGGFETIGAGLTGLARVADIATHLVLPVVSLALIFLAIYLRLMRASMLEVMSLDFVRTARAKGLPEGKVLRRHVLRNALLPMVTFVGLQFSTMLGGSVVIESVFSLPGLGRLAFESVVQRDLNTLFGIVLVSALLVILVNFLVDLLYARLDPRIGA
jgi:peptide/nickel transport system permease protein